MTSNDIAKRDEFVQLSSPKEVQKFAIELKKYVVEQGLFTPIQGKNYVNVEGWQYAGASMGMLPMVVSCDDISTEGEIKYKATVEIVSVKNGNKVASGVAICSSKEAKRKNADEYVIASMAQTRAVGKAFRLSIGWIMKLAGYESTPTEEIEYIDPNDNTSTSTADVGAVLEKIKSATTTDELRAIRQGLDPQLRLSVTPAIDNRLKELSGE